MCRLGEKIRKFMTIFKHPSVGRNVHLARLARNALPYYFRRDGRAHFPLNVYFIVNNVCNLRCRMCDVGSGNDDRIFARNLGRAQDLFLTGEKIREIIDEISEFKPCIGFTSTEPLLRKDLLDVSEYILAKKLELLVTTNGYLLEDFARGFVDIGLTRLNVSIDGPASVHNLIRGRDDAFERAVAGLRLVNEAKTAMGANKPKTFATCTITNLNYANLYEFVESVKDVGIDQINFQLSYFVTENMMKAHNEICGKKYPVTVTCMGEGIDPQQIDVDVLWEQIVAIRKDFSHQCVFLFDLNKTQLRTYFYDHQEFVNSLNCVFPWFIAQIKTTGELIGLTRCYPIVLGDLRKGSFKEQWNGESMRNFRMDLQKHGRFTACSRCEGVLYR